MTIAEIAGTSSYAAGGIGDSGTFTGGVGGNGGRADDGAGAGPTPCCRHRIAHTFNTYCPLTSRDTPPYRCFDPLTRERDACHFECFSQASPGMGPELVLAIGMVRSCGLGQNCPVRGFSRGITHLEQEVGGEYLRPLRDPNGRSVEGAPIQAVRR